MISFIKFQELYTVKADNFYYPVVKSKLHRDTIKLSREALDVWSIFSERSPKSYKKPDDICNEHLENSPDENPITNDWWFMFSEKDSLLQFCREPEGKNVINLGKLSFRDDSILNHLESKLDLYYFFEERKKLTFDACRSKDYSTNLSIKEECILYNFFRAAWVAYSYNNGKGNNVTEEDFRWYTRLPVLNGQGDTKKE